MIEEKSVGEYLQKQGLAPKIWRSDLNGQPIIEFEAWVSTEAIDRDGEIIRADGWRKPSLQSAKFLLFHNQLDLAIGKSYWTRSKEDDSTKGLYTRGRFGPQPAGLAIGELYLNGDMDSFSVGFRWYKRIFDEQADGVKKPFYEYIDQDLWEYSAVNVPANPEATIAMMGMLNDAGDLKDMMAIIKSFTKPAIKGQTFSRDSYITKTEKGVIAYHDYGNADESESWDGPGTVAQCDVAKLKKICAWYDSEYPDLKSSYKLPHHNVDLKAVWRGVANAMARLGQTDMPDDAKKGSYNHLARHYKDFDKEPPEYGKAISQDSDIFEILMIKDEQYIASEFEGDDVDIDDIDLDDEVEVDALDFEGDTETDDVSSEVLVEVGDDAEVEVDI